MPSNEALRFAAIPLALAGFGTLGYGLVASAPQADTAAGGSQPAGASPNAGGRREVTTPFPRQKFDVVFDAMQFKTVTFNSNTEAEAISGYIEHGKDTVDALLAFDGTTLTGSGKVVVKVDAMRTGIATRDEHLRSDKWLDAAKHPAITYTVDSIAHQNGDTFTLNGTWSMHGVDKPFSTTATIRYIDKDRANAAQLNQTPGDTEWVRIESSFRIKLTDHGVTVGSKKVEDAWAVTVNLSGRVVKK